MLLGCGSSNFIKPHIDEKKMDQENIPERTILLQLAELMKIAQAIEKISRPLSQIELSSK